MATTAAVTTTIVVVVVVVAVATTTTAATTTTTAHRSVTTEFLRLGDIDGITLSDQHFHSTIVFHTMHFGKVPSDEW